MFVGVRAGPATMTDRACGGAIGKGVAKGNGIPGSYLVCLPSPLAGGAK